jgi:hypothetical protein
MQEKRRLRKFATLSMIRWYLIRRGKRYVAYCLVSSQIWSIELLADRCISGQVNADDRESSVLRRAVMCGECLLDNWEVSFDSAYDEVREHGSDPLEFSGVLRCA